MIEGGFGLDDCQDQLCVKTEDLLGLAGQTAPLLGCGGHDVVRDHRCGRRVERRMPHRRDSGRLPAFTVALSYISTYIRLIRNNMLENMREDYVLYARARGLKQRSILVRHILKNSLQSCVTAIGMSIPQLIAGTIVVENVFAWPGVGRLCIASIFNRDYPVIQAYVLLVGVLFVFFNLFFDILQYVADPRLRERKA